MDGEVTNDEESPKERHRKQRLEKWRRNPYLRVVKMGKMDNRHERRKKGKT